MDRFSKFVRDRKIVSIHRDHIDTNSIQGFILGFSDDLILIQYVYDFRLDGLLVLMVSDITDIKSNATNEFQKDLLIAEGLFQQIPFDLAFELHDWRSIISQFSRQYRLMILEDERPDSKVFLIGEIKNITKTNISLRYFTGAGNWNEKPMKLSFNSITSCQVDTNYTNVYQRYFDRQP